ncbi:ead/Ea22-like family protein [Enterobacter hormaechei]|nr:ead/Ea22-like family protein [Enterobacter hormaechei]
MSNIDKQSLRTAAENATPGEWCTDDYHGVIADAGLNANYYIASCSGPDNRSNKRFIAAANPATVLALLDELEAMHKYAKDRDAENEGLMITVGRLRVEKEAAESRIAELEAREVNLPKLSVGEVMHMSGFSRDYAEGWCSGNDNAIHEIHAAGVKVAAAAGKGEEL